MHAQNVMIWMAPFLIRPESSALHKADIARQAVRSEATARDGSSGSLRLPDTSGVATVLTVRVRAPNPLRLVSLRIVTSTPRPSAAGHPAPVPGSRREAARVATGTPAVPPRPAR